MKTLSAAAFSRLSFERKCDVVTFEGRFMMMRTQGECKMFLYHTNGFYVEVCFSSSHQKVLIINAIDMKALDPYLQEIAIADLFPEPRPKPKKRPYRKKRKPGDWDDLLNKN